MKSYIGGFYWISFAIILWFAIGCMPSPDPVRQKAGIEKRMDSIKTVYVPDRRVQIFDYDVSEDGRRIIGKTSNPESYEAVLRLKGRYSDLVLDSFELAEPLDVGLINVSVGNIRSFPRHSSELSTQALMGHEMIVWERRGGWYYIQTPDEYLGWIDAGALKVLSSEEKQTYQQAEKMMYLDDFGFAYSKPDLSSSVVSDLTAGNIFRKKGIKSGMIEIEFPDGRTAFIPQDAAVDLDALRSRETPDWASIEETAFRFLGRPYLWGGTSGKGVDCSGFTKMVYYLNGLELPRDASQQIRKGKEIPVDDRLTEVEPGDFLFFGTKDENGRPDRVTHVAIYLGNGKMIHSSERVQVNSLFPEDPDFAPSRKETLLIAKRMITEEEIDPELQLQAIREDPGYGFH